MFGNKKRDERIAALEEAVGRLIRDKDMERAQAKAQEVPSPVSVADESGEPWIKPRRS